MSVNKMVVTRNFPGIGDAVTLKPLIEIEKERNPDTEIIVQTLSWIAPIFEAEPEIDKIITSKSEVPEDVDYLLRIEDSYTCPCIEYEDRMMPNVDKDRCQIHCEAAGLPYDGRPPRLRLTQEEQAQAEVLRARYQGTNVGIHLKASEEYRNYPHMDKLVEYIRYKTDWNIFLIEKHDVPQIDNTVAIVNRPIREVMTHLKAMDMVIGVDSGILFLAGALGVPVYGIFGPTDPKMRIDVFDNSYWNKQYKTCKRSYCWYANCNKRWCLQTLSPQKIYRDVKDKVSLGSRKKSKLSKIAPFVFSHAKNEPIGLLRLDGLGGTLTLSDQAKKIKEKFNRPVTLIIRQYRELFEKNPYVDDIITVGGDDWGKVLNEMKGRFDSLVDIRFAIPKWYGNGYRQNGFEKWKIYYDGFPLYHNQLEKFKLHHIQLTDKILELPYEKIESAIYYDVPLPESLQLPADYICINSGIDSIHRGKLQTKCWPHWHQFVELSDMPVVQTGTQFDPGIPGTIDLRDKTGIKDLIAVLKNARIIVTIEGGIMHLAYAAGCPNTMILRGPTTGKLFEYPGQIMVDAYPCNGCWSEKEDWHFRCQREMLTPVCMKSILPERVNQICKGMLKNEQLSEKV